MVEDSPLKKQQYVSDIVADWFNENNAFLLAKEGEVVYWDSVTGKPEDYKWQRMTVIEVSRIIKVMMIPPSHMSYCTTDAVYTAAQETGRAYQQGVRSTKQVKPIYFNYTEHELVRPTALYQVTQWIMTKLFESKMSPKWDELQELIYMACDLCGGDYDNVRVVNDTIRQVAKDLGYRVCHGKTRYTWKAMKWQCLRYPDSVGVSIIFDGDKQWLAEEASKQVK